MNLKFNKKHNDIDISKNNKDTDKDYDTLSEKYNDYFPNLNELSKNMDLYNEYCNKNEKTRAMCEGYAELKRVSQKVKTESIKKWKARISLILSAGILAAILIIFIIYLPDIITKLSDAIPDTF